MRNRRAVRARPRRPTLGEQQALARRHHKYRLRYSVCGCLARPAPHFEFFVAQGVCRLLGAAPAGHAVLLIRVRRARPPPP